MAGTVAVVGAVVGAVGSGVGAGVAVGAIDEDGPVLVVSSGQSESALSSPPALSERLQLLLSDLMSKPRFTIDF